MFFRENRIFFVGNRQSEIVFEKMKTCEVVRYFFIPWLYQNLQSLKSYDCTNTHWWWQKWIFSYFSPKSRTLHKIAARKNSLKTKGQRHRHRIRAERDTEFPKNKGGIKVDKYGEVYYGITGRGFFTADISHFLEQKTFLEKKKVFFSLKIFFVPKSD